ncbi:hypothetical protein HDU83_006748 [Entophlyctis luteolus]|nr:hypothetical protein HDU83_006748 [Entophlyctis luteolus]
MEDNDRQSASSKGSHDDSGEASRADYSTVPLNIFSASPEGPLETSSLHGSAVEGKANAEEGHVEAAVVVDSPAVEPSVYVDVSEVPIMDPNGHPIVANEPVLQDDDFSSAIESISNLSQSNNGINRNSSSEEMLSSLKVPESKLGKARRSLKQIIWNKLIPTLGQEDELVDEFPSFVITPEITSTSELCQKTSEQPLTEISPIEGIIAPITRKRRKSKPPSLFRLAMSLIRKEVSTRKSSSSLTANYGSSFAAMDDCHVDVHSQHYMLPSNIHLDHKPSIASSSVLAPETRNGLTGRRVTDGNTLTASSVMLPGGSSVTLKSSLLRNQSGKSTSKLSSLRVDLDDGAKRLRDANFKSSRSLAGSFFLIPGGEKTSQNDSHRILQGLAGMESISGDLYGLPNTADICSKTHSRPKLPRKTGKLGDEESTQLPTLNSLLQDSGERDFEVLEQQAKKDFELQNSKFSDQNKRPSYIPRPVSNRNDPKELKYRIEIVPLSLVQTENDTVKQDKEGDPVDLQSNEITAAKEQRKSASRSKLNAESAPGSPGKARKSGKRHMSTVGRQVTVLRRDGFGTEGSFSSRFPVAGVTNSNEHVLVQRGGKSAQSDVMEAFLSTHHPMSPKARTPHTRARHPPGPNLPPLEPRPITALLKTRFYRDTSDECDKPAGTHPSDPDATLGSYAQPLPITRYVPLRQKQPSQRAAKLRKLRAQREADLHRAYLGNTAVCPSRFLRRTANVITGARENALVFGGAVQGLAPTFNGAAPSHQVYANLGRVHWQEYSCCDDARAKNIAGGAKNGSTRSMIDDLLRRNGIQRIQLAETDAKKKSCERSEKYDAGKASAISVLRAVENVACVHSETVERKVSLGGGFIYNKNRRRTIAEGVSANSLANSLIIEAVAI